MFICHILLPISSLNCGWLLIFGLRGRNAFIRGLIGGGKWILRGFRSIINILKSFPGLDMKGIWWLQEGIDSGFCASSGTLISLFLIEI